MKHVKPNIDPATKQPYQVRMPSNPKKFMPVYGAEVPNDVYWHRRIKDGSVVEITKAQYTQGKTAAGKAAKKAADKAAQTEE